MQACLLILISNYSRNLSSKNTHYLCTTNSMLGTRISKPSVGKSGKILSDYIVTSLKKLKNYTYN